MRPYHCDALLFGRPIKLTVTPSDTSPVEPNLFVLTPLLPEERPGPDVCLATGFRPQGGQMVLKVQNSSDTRSTGGAALSLKEKTYFFAGFSSERIDSCELHKTVAQRKEPDLSHCWKKQPDDPIPSKAAEVSGFSSLRTTTAAAAVDWNITTLTPPASLEVSVGAGVVVPKPPNKPPRPSPPAQTLQPGPLPSTHTETASPGHGAEPLSCVLGLHTWLKSTCRSHDMDFMDNFNLFWDRASLFKRDEIHPTETVKDCGDLRPEKARLNFYLLVMNGVRVLFTKTLAFNTILTIRAVLF